MACALGRVDVVEERLTAGADVNEADNAGWTPLYFAAMHGHEAVVKVLIEAGAEVNKARDNGETPLTTAVTECHEADDAVAHILRDVGAA